MPVFLIRILFFALVPVGMVVLVKAIKLVRKRFSGKLLVETSLIPGQAKFEITRKGVYAIWLKGQLYRKVPAAAFKPVIKKENDQELLMLRPSLIRPQVNGFGTGRIELFIFSALPGEYRICLGAGSSVPALENVFFSRVPRKKADLQQYFIQIRESQPLYRLLAGFLLMVLAGACIIGGIVLGLLAGSL